MNDDEYFWKDRQLDPESRRTFEGLVWCLIAGFLLLVLIMVVKS